MLGQAQTQTGTVQAGLQQNASTVDDTAKTVIAASHLRKCALSCAWLCEVSRQEIERADTAFFAKKPEETPTEFQQRIRALHQEVSEIHDAMLGDLHALHHLAARGEKVSLSPLTDKAMEALALLKQAHLSNKGLIEISRGLTTLDAAFAGQEETLSSHAVMRRMQQSPDRIQKLVESFLEKDLFPSADQLTEYEQELLEVFEAMRSELVNTSLRVNPYINYRSSKKGKSVTCESANTEALFYSLVGDKVSLPIVAVDTDDNKDTPSENVPEVSFTATDSIRVHMDPDSFNDQMLFISQRAEEHLATKGVNPLCVCLGMLHWQPHDSKTMRQAPVIQLPVTLEANTSTGTYSVRLDHEVLEENGPLRKRLADEFGIQLPPFTAGSDPREYFAEVQRVISRKQGWSLDTRSVTMGLFSSGVALYDDLDPGQWEYEQKPWRNPLVAPLLSGGYHAVAEEPREQESLEQIRDITETPPFFGCDSSQERVLVNFARGNSTVLIGPPGSGKSFAIAEALAQAVWRGEKALFVCQKPAALDVVYRRLELLGLGPLVLSLGTGDSKKEIYQDLQETIALGKPEISIEYQSALETFQQAEAQVQSMTDALSQVHSRSGFTASEITGKALALDVQSYNSTLHELDSIDSAVHASIQGHCRDIQQEIDRSGLPSDNIFSSSRITACSPSDKAYLREQVQEGRELVDRLVAAVHDFQTRGGMLPGDSSLDAVRESVGLLKQYRTQLAALPPEFDQSQLRSDTKDWRTHGHDLCGLLGQFSETLEKETAYRSQLHDQAFEQDLEPLLNDLRSAGSGMFFFVKPSYWRTLKEAKKLFNPDEKPGYAECEGALSVRVLADDMRETIKLHEPLLQRLCGTLPAYDDAEAWHALATAARIQHDFYSQTPVHNDTRFLETMGAQYVSVPDTIEKARSAVETALQDFHIHHRRVHSLLKMEGDESSAMILEQQCHYQNWEGQWHRLEDMIRMNTALEKLDGEAPWLTVYIRSLSEQSEALTRDIEKQWLATCVHELYEESPALKSFDNVQFERARTALNEAEEALKQACVERLLVNHWEQIPRTVTGGRLAVLEKELSRSSRHRPVSEFLKECGDPVQTIKPIVLATPRAVAEYLPRSMTFDRFVGDEGSQQEVVDALGSLQRVNRSDGTPVSALVAGDDMQMAPSRLFRKGSGSSDEGVSILDRMLERQASRYMLTGSYRFKDPSLVQCSNVRFYHGKLRVFPSAYMNDRSDVGLKYHFHPDHVYRGKGANPQEATAVAQRAMDLILEDPTQTIGLVAFSQEQMKLILKAMQKLRKQHPEAEPYFSQHEDEPFFVRNLENVQGDERDIIIVSTSFGKDEDGTFRRQFGSLNRPNGEKGLNVLFTRAKRRCEIHTAIDPDWIETDDVRSEAIHALKAYLQYARDGMQHVEQESPQKRVSPFESYLTNLLEAEGYRVEHRVGTQGCYVNLAIHDPEHSSDTYLAGVLINDEQFLEAGSFRERDAITESVLSSLGWNIAYCHSIGFLRDPEGEKKRLLEMLEAVKAGGHTAESTFGRLEAREVARDQQAGTITRARGVRYEEKVIAKNTDLQDYDTLYEAVEEIIRVESPIHLREIQRRIRDGMGVKRLSADQERQVDSVLYDLQGDEVWHEGEFYWHNDTPCELRSRDHFKGAHKRLDLIAPEEMREALRFTVAHAGGIRESDAIEAACIALGFKSTPRDAQPRLVPLLHEMIYHEGAFVVHQDELLPLPDTEKP